MIGLTRRQQDALNFLIDFHDQNGIYPSFDEIKDGIGLASKSGVHRLLTALEKRGYIRRLPDRARAIEVFSHV